MMDATAIKQITSLAQPNLVERYGFEYSDKPLHVVAPPQVETLAFKTLRGLASTIKSEHHNYHELVAIVKDQCTVEVVTSIMVQDRQREHPYVAKADTPDFAFGSFMPYEQMMIALKSKFVETPELLELVKLLGTITEENSAAMSDDGFTQSVVVKKGVALKDNRAINPKVMLTPFRTFIEVQQPKSEFLIRLREGGLVALFEADGGAWRLEARHNVAEFLRTELESLIVANYLQVVE